MRGTENKSEAPRVLGGGGLESGGPGERRVLLGRESGAWIPGKSLGHPAGAAPGPRDTWLRLKFHFFLSFHFFPLESQHTGFTKYGLKSKPFCD